MKKIILILGLFFIFGCNDNHECCDHTKLEKERQDYSYSLSKEGMDRYIKCKSEKRTFAEMYCYQQGLNRAIIERCIDAYLHDMCK